MLSPSFSLPAVWQRVVRFPFVTTFAVVLLLQMVGEQFPFSPFPMYSGFSGETTVLFVADGQGKPIAINDYFRLSASKVKKAYGTELKRVCEQKGYGDGNAKPEDVRAAGQATIAFLQTQTRPTAPKRIAARGLQLYRISLTMDKKGFHETTELVGELVR